MRVAIEISAIESAVGQEPGHERLAAGVDADQVAGPRATGGRAPSRSSPRPSRAGSRAPRRRAPAFGSWRCTWGRAPSPPRWRPRGGASASSTPRSQIGVAIEPGSTIETAIPQGAQLLAEDVADGLERELRGVVGAEHLDRHQTADRADEDDPARGRRGSRDHRLGDGDVGGQVDLDLASEFLDRQRLERPRNGDPGVVDEAVEASPLGLLAMRWAAAAICSALVMSSISGRSRSEPASRRESASSSRRTPA